MRPASIAVILLYTFYIVFAFRIKQVHSYCSYNGKSYSVGEVWKVSSMRSCRQCKCFQERRIRCLSSCSRDAQFPKSLLSTFDVSKPVVQRGRKGLQCSLEGKPHGNGESWTEHGNHSKSIGANKCMQCNCKMQVITCAIRRCPGLKCANPVDQHGTCCKTCPDEKTPKKPTSRGCTSIERFFDNNESWQWYLPSTNVLSTCIDCNCMNGREYCTKHLCPQTMCAKPVKRPGDCCALCPGQRLSTRSGKGTDEKVPSIGIGMFRIFLQGTKKKNPGTKKTIGNDKSKNTDNPTKTKPTLSSTSNSKKACVLQTNPRLIYQHNELFYPVLDAKVQKCTKCHCLNSLFNCARIKCPHRYPCVNPVFRNGFCCKVCPGMTDREARNLETIRMPQSRGCGKAKRSHVQVYLYEDGRSSAAQLSAKYLFDKSHQLGNKRSEVHQLHLINMAVNVTRQRLDHDDVIRNLLNKNWTYLGQIKEKLFARFSRQERDLEQCHNAIKCIKKLTHMIEQLKTRAARKRRCRSPPSRSLQILQR